MKCCTCAVLVTFIAHASGGNYNSMLSLLLPVQLSLAPYNLKCTQDKTIETFLPIIIIITAIPGVAISHPMKHFFTLFSCRYNFYDLREFFTGPIMSRTAAGSQPYLDGVRSLMLHDRPEKRAHTLASPFERLPRKKNYWISNAANKCTQDSSL